jgi:4,5-dihydroxyphthalate decarboxylase
MLKTLMGDHEVTRQFKTRTDKLNFIEVKGSAAQYFKRVVRDLEFDVAEMAIITYLIAKAYDKPYRLLPFTVLARYQHPFLVYNAARGTLTPEDLHGKRVGVRSYSVTTGAWIRNILAEDHGVDIARIKWVTFEEAHVAEFRDPPGRRSARCSRRASSTRRSSARSRPIRSCSP